MIALAPSSVKDCFDLTVSAVNLAERFRVPVMVLSDASIGHMREKLLVPDSVVCGERKRPTVTPEEFLTYDTDKPDGVPSMADLGTAYHSHYTSFMHHKNGLAAWTDLETTEALIKRLSNKIMQHQDKIIMLERLHLEDAEVAIVAYGSTSRPAKAAVTMAREKGIKAGLLKLLTIWPFPGEEIRCISERANVILVPELNMGQLLGEVERSVLGNSKVIGLNRVDGALITPEQIFARLEEVI